MDGDRFGIDSDQNGGQVHGRGAGVDVPFDRKHVMGLVHQNPVRPPGPCMHLGQRPDEPPESGRPILDADREHVDDHAFARALERLDHLRQPRRRLGVAERDGGGEAAVVAFRIENANLKAAGEHALDQRCRKRRLPAAG